LSFSLISPFLNILSFSLISPFFSSSLNDLSSDKNKTATQQYTAQEEAKGKERRIRCRKCRSTFPIEDQEEPKEQQREEGEEGEEGEPKGQTEPKEQKEQKEPKLNRKESEPNQRDQRRTDLDKQKEQGEEAKEGKGGAFQKLSFTHFLSEQSQHPIDPRETKCGMCQKEIGEFFCQECAQFQCQECNFLHLRIPLLQGHQRVLVEDFVKENFVLPRSLACPFHPALLLDLYCWEEGAVICLKCFAENHSNHRTCSLTESVSVFRKEISEKLLLVCF